MRVPRLPLGLLLLPLALAAELIPFTLPWDDTSGNLTNLSGSLHAPAGRWGWITVGDDGHYELAGERVRFFGVNIGAGACFPPQAKAQAIAERLARFGFNVARFHHMENGWTTSLLDYGTGNSRTFHAANLDRLDRLVAELKAAGVYVNFNLLTSRVFRSGDGLPAEVDSMDWKEQHILAFFDETSLALHQEHAAQLLGHLNPYTGLTYAEDPALAFVEINNENGLAHQWFSGAMDRLPDVFLDKLAARWNGWLQAHYTDSAALADAWGIVEESEGPNLLANGDFTSGTSGWSFEQHQGAAGTFTTGTFGGRAGARVTTTTTGDGWHIQLNHPGLAVTEGQIYTLRFWAKASTPFNLSVGLRQAHSPWGSAGFGTGAALTTSWQLFEYTFFANLTDANVRVDFSGMGSQLASYDFAAVELREGGSAGSFGEGISLEEGNLPALLTRDTLLPAQRRDWFDFLRALEREYWVEMQRYVKEDLHYHGIVWGTTIMNSPPSVQGVFDAVDAHNYWQHPHFPGTSWSATNWTVDNEPMVNAADGGNIGKLALEAVDGFPINITEYQHSAPNTYSSDAGLFLALYGSLQDWDGLYFFHYGSASDDWDRGHFNGFFDLDQHSPKLVNAALGSLLFRRFAVAAAKEKVAVRFDADRELDVLAGSGSAWNVANLSHLGVDRRLALVHQLRMSLEAEAPGVVGTAPPAPGGAETVSDTGELRWNRENPSAGFVTLDAPTAKAFLGFDAGRAFTFEGLAFDPGTTEQGWCTFAAVLLEGHFATLATGGGRGLIATTGNVENTGMVWTDVTKTSVSNQWGTAPVLTENVPGTLTFPGLPPEKLRVWALDVRGDRATELTVTSDGAGGAQVALGGAGGSLWYEFEVATVSAPAAVWNFEVESRRADRVSLHWSGFRGTTAHQFEYALDGGEWQPAEGLAHFNSSGQGRFTLAGLPEGTPLSFRLTPENTSGAGPSSTLETHTRRTYATWANAAFTASELLDPGISGRFADPDGDGLQNELEAAFDLNPFVAEPSPLPLPTAETTLENLRLFQWELAPGATDPFGPPLALLYSADLTHWTAFDGTSPYHGDSLFRFLATRVGADDLPVPAFWRWTTAED